MTALKNPGPEIPELLEFDEIPSLGEFLRHSGVPGVEYLFVAAKNQPNAQLEGWNTIVGVPFFKIGGVGSTLMARGTPLKNTPAQPGTSKCFVFADDEILEAVKSSPMVVMGEVEGTPQATEPTTTVIPKHTSTATELLKQK